MATLLDIAQAAGVSKMTVSNALRGKSNVSEATRTRIIQAANQLNYQTNLAARALSSGRIGILELIIQDLDSPFYGKLAKEVSLAADRHGMQMLIRQSLYSAESEKSALSTTNSLFCDGLILATPQLSGKEARRLAQQRPLILIDDCSPDPQLATVNTPNYEGAYQAVTHLLSVGVTCPLLLGGTFINDIDAIAANVTNATNADTANANTANATNQDTAGAINPDTANPDTTNATNPDTTSPDTAQNTLLGHTPTHRPLRTVNELRVAGAAQALRDANLTLNPTQCLPIEWTYDLARKAIHDIAQRFPAGTFPFDGIFGMSDVAALGAIRGLQDIGLRVPDDVKVIGFDGVTYGDITTPSLSTIDIDMTAMANIIVTRLMEQLDRTHKSENKLGANAANITSEADKSEADTTRTAHTDNAEHAAHATSARGQSAYTPTVDIAPFTLRARESTFSRDVRKA